MHEEDSLLELSSSAVQLVADPSHLVGSTIAGRFVVETHVATVDGRQLYAGSQPALERPVAIKLVADATNADLCGRFLKEGRLLAKLDHPGIVSVIDVGEHDGRPYVVTEAPKGDTLEAILEVRGRIDWRAAHDLMVALSEAVGCAHTAGLVHRDLHPRNVVVGAEGLPRITDFVFAYETAPFDDEERTQLFTARGALVGAMEWVAPEQLLGLPVDARADLYSLGVIAYRMVSGSVPFESNRAGELLAQQADGAEPLMERAKLPEAARPFAELVDRLLASDAGKRGFINASELAAALRALRSAPAPAAELDESEMATEFGLPDRKPVRLQQKPSLPEVAATVKKRALELARKLEVQARPLVAKVKALPRKLQIGIGAGIVVVSVVSFAAFASDDEPEFQSNPITAPAAEELAEVDPSDVAVREDARRAFARKDIPRALHAYRTLAKGSPEAFEVVDLDNVVVYLARPNRNTGVAEEILIATAPRSVPALRAAFDSDSSSRYLKRRSGEVLEKLGEPVDLVPLWISTLQSDECGARKLAVKRLVELDDERAVEPLSQLARGMSCGSQEARAALRSLGASG